MKQTIEEGPKVDQLTWGCALWTKVRDVMVRDKYNLFSIFWKTMRFVIRKIGYTILASFLLMFLTSLRPFVKIKFCGMILGRIGHLAANTELFVRRLWSGNFEDNYLYIGCNAHGMEVANEQLLRMFKRKLSIIESKLIGNTINNYIIRKSKYYMELPFRSNEYYEFNNLPKVLNFTKEEETFGRQGLERMGIGSNDWYVCFHARDNIYLWEKHRQRKENIEYDFRNCDISNFEKAMMYIAERGGYAIRMGSVVEKPLPELSNPRIIDYATKFRSDFMDIYLSAKCKFFVGSTAGLHCVPTIFGVPVAGTNFTHIELPPLRNEDIFIPKKIWNREECRFLGFGEIFARGIGNWHDTNLFIEAGLDVVENTPGEVLGLVEEMNKSLAGEFEYTEEDIELQNKYNSLIRPHHRCYKNPARIGVYFLRANKELLQRTH